MESPGLVPGLFDFDARDGASLAVRCGGSLIEGKSWVAGPSLTKSGHDVLGQPLCVMAGLGSATHDYCGAEDLYKYSFCRSASFH
jgi:hypothetical protein